MEAQALRARGKDVDLKECGRKLGRLLALVPYSGIGYGTTIGFGQTELVGRHQRRR